MIKSKQEYLEYLKADAVALGKENQKKPKRIGDDIWKFQRLMRKCEYSLSWRGGGKILSKFYRYRFYKTSRKLNYSIPLNVFGKGLALVHAGPIVVSPYAKVGEYCRLQTMTVIGATNGKNLAPKIGNRCYIAVGAKVIGDICIADNVAIGAGAVVVKSIEQSGITVGGVPAKKISDNGADIHLQYKE